MPGNRSSDYNSRQYALMVDVIRAYEANEIGLPRLIEQLEGLIAALEDVGGELRNAFLSRWGVLEDIHAAAIHHGRNVLDEAEIGRIRSALTEIKAAAAKRIVAGTG